MRAARDFTAAAGQDQGKQDKTKGGCGKAGRSHAPFSLRLSVEERAALDRAAGSEPLGAYIRSRLFSEDAALPAPRRRRREVVADHAALGRVLGALGQSRLSNNLNQIAKAAHLGALPMSDDLAAELRDACADIAAMRADLMRALGYGQDRGA